MRFAKTERLLKELMKKVDGKFDQQQTKEELGYNYNEVRMALAELKALSGELEKLMELIEDVQQKEVMGALQSLILDKIYATLKQLTLKCEVN